MGSCTSLSTCSTCSSGPSVCPSTTTTTTASPSGCDDCFEVGRCNGNTVGTDLANDECECQEMCSMNSNCKVFTFDSSNNICSLTGNCSSVSTCSTCLNGPPECPAGECQDCFSPGNCQGAVLQSTIVNSDCECQDACAAATGCTDFTYDSSNSICTLTSDCPTVGSCATCVNGPRVCSTTTPQPNTTATPPGGCGDCYEQGTCQGTVVAVDLADSLCDCVDMCKNTTDCEYMTYTQSNMICTMTRDCQTISTTCADCLTGPKECPPDTACSDCSEPGQCQGTVVDVFIVEDICECKASCQNSTTGCEFLSFDNSTGICTETSTCGTVDKTCKDCSWMPRTCGNEGCGDCLTPGIVYGDVVAVDFQNTVCDCKRDCENTQGCNFWTFDESNDICTLMANDDGGTGNTCETCTWGPKECPTSNNYLSHFMHM